MLCHILMNVYRYTSGEVKYWNLGTRDSCIFQPTNTSLSISEAYDIGTEQNVVKSVVTSENVSAALYSQGKSLKYILFYKTFTHAVLLMETPQICN